jgi:hypothetical protein
MPECTCVPTSKALSLPILISSLQDIFIALIRFPQVEDHFLYHAELAVGLVTPFAGC